MSLTITAIPDITGGVAPQAALAGTLSYIGPQSDKGDIPMRRWRDETYLAEIDARRKGRGQAACEIKAGYLDRGAIVLRTVDRDGIAPIVALLTPAQARELAKALREAAGEVES